MAKAKYITLWWRRSNGHFASAAYAKRYPNRVTRKRIKRRY